MAAVIDTLEIAHELREAGVPEAQAEAIARLFKRRYEADREELVTKAYLDFALERQAAELRAEMARHAAETKADLARLERDLILKLGGIIALVAGIIGALGVLF